MISPMVVKILHSKNALVLGSCLICFYIESIIFTLAFPSVVSLVATMGGVAGGIGTSIIWTAQGSYLAKSAESHSFISKMPMAKSTSYLAGVFGTLFFLCEYVVKCLSYIYFHFWNNELAIFFCYFSVSFMALIGFFYVKDVDFFDEIKNEKNRKRGCYNVTSGLRILIEDPKMKYMIGMPIAYGTAVPFMNTYVSVEIIEPSISIAAVSGMSTFSCLSSIIFSLVATYISMGVGNASIIIIAGTSFCLIGFSFFLYPDPESWGLWGLVCVSCLLGIGRSTYDGVFRASVSELFYHNIEAAFAALHFIDNCASATLYHFASKVPWATFEWLLVISSLAFIFGHWRAEDLHLKEKRSKEDMMSTRISGVDEIENSAVFKGAFS